MNKTATWNQRLFPLIMSLLWLGAGAGPGCLLAADYLGAAGVLRAVEERHAGAGQKAPVTNESAQLSADLNTFSQTSGSLPPAEAAQRWLELADRSIKVQSHARSSDYMSYGQNDASALLAALPPPVAWPDLARAVAARPPARDNGEIREIGLSFLAALLTGDTNAQNQVISQLSAKAQAADMDTAYVYRNYLDQLSQTILTRSDNPEAILQMLNRQIASASPNSQQSVTVPNLVAQVGPDRARAFLRQALLTPNVTLSFNEAGETSRLAQQVAREILPQLKSPHWELINSLDAVDLYEAMDRQFGAPTNTAASGSGTAVPGLPGLPNLPVLSDASFDLPRAEAQIYYMLGLISVYRTTEAVAVAKKLNGRSVSYSFDEAFKAMEHAGYTDALDNFLHELLAQNPDLPFWDQYVELAAHAGTTDRMLVLVRGALAKDSLSDSKKAGLEQILFKALLAADQVDDGVAQLRLLAAQEDPAPQPGPNGDNFNAGQLGVILMRLGMLVQNPAWIEEGLGLAKQWLAKQADSTGPSVTSWEGTPDGESADVTGALAQILQDLQRGPEAEALLTDALARTTVPKSATPGVVWQPSTARPILTDLAVLYHQAGRNQDVLDLLEQSPDWGASDLSELLETAPAENPVPVMWLHTGSSPLPIPYLAAHALLVTGQREAAQKILGPLQDRYPGLDRCFELLIALDGTNAIPQLDAWFKRDQFEERPLIWKAHLLRQEGQLAVAEQTIRQAISIDPSDGEEGRGDRMRAYAELAEIRAARGDEKEADFYREVVKAIRMSEEADQYYQAGLLKRAIKIYEQSLDHFSDAYCIQSRLAIQLAALGENALAEEHYRRAYELMPDSFGRVESHCFGCEKAFAGEHAQGIAEQVFTQFAAAHPDKPQVYYLLGYLRTEEERFSEARTNYLTATRLDPDYLNAWVKLQEADEQVLVPARERDPVAFNILRLDPLHRHTQATFENVTDLAGLWQAAAAATALQSPSATNLMTLTASKLAREKTKTDSQQAAMIMEMVQIRVNNQMGRTPAALVARTSFVSLAGQMIMNNNSMDQ